MSNHVVETMEAIQVIGEEGGLEAASLLGGLLAASARDLEWTLERLYESEKAAHEQTKEHLRKLEDQYYTMQHRLRWLMGLEEDPNPIFYD